jgi:hypothetical protein
MDQSPARRLDDADASTGPGLCRRPDPGIGDVLPLQQFDSTLADINKLNQACVVIEQGLLRRSSKDPAKLFEFRLRFRGRDFFTDIDPGQGVGTVDSRRGGRIQ